jgi:hypothetical protein
MPLSDTIKTLIRDAWDDGYPCLVATNGPQDRTSPRKAA